MMLRLTQPQMHALDLLAEHEYLVLVAKMLRECLPLWGQQMSEADLLEHVRRSKIEAGRFGIVSEAGIARFASLALLVGHEFHCLPGVQQVWSSPKTDYEDKLELLFEALVARKS